MPQDDTPFQLSDPLATLQRVLEREVGRAERRRLELAEIGQALFQLSRQGGWRPGTAGGPAWEPVSADLASVLVERLLQSTDGPVRACVAGLDTGPWLDREVVERGRAQAAAGMVRRAVYPVALLDQPPGRRWLREWAEVGEDQRICLDPPSDFAVFGSSAVMAAQAWGDAGAGHVLVREPMLVQAFTHLFDLVFERGLSVPTEQQDAGGDPELLRLLSRGLKDEAIARYLGCSLRTVRRRVAGLMARHGAQTRFQLGAAAAAAGAVDPPSTPPWHGLGRSRPDR